MDNTDVPCSVDAQLKTFLPKNISRVKLFCRSISSGSIVDGVVVDELQDLLDVVVDNVIGKWEEDSPFNLLQVNFRAELFEKVLVFVETDGEEVKKVANIHIVRQAAEVACQLSIEVHHVLEVWRVSIACSLDGAVEAVHLLGQHFNPTLHPDEKAVSPNPLFLLLVLDPLLLGGGLLLFLHGQDPTPVLLSVTM